MESQYREDQIKEQMKRLKELALPYDDLLRLTAALMNDQVQSTNETESMLRIIDEFQRASYVSTHENLNHQQKQWFLKELQESGNKVAAAFLEFENNVKKAQARANAQRRHLETYALRKEVVDYWRAKVDIKLSAEKAATELTKIFPLSHRKISEYIRSARKEMRAASKV